MDTLWVYNSFKLNTIEAAARKAGQELLASFDKHVQVQEKIGHQNLVTEADFHSQKTIKEFLLARLSELGIDPEEIGFLGEEGLDDEGATYTFIIDPLDGTTNFVSGIAYFAVSIACLKNGELLFGVTYNPVTDTMYSAEKDKGATKTQAGVTSNLQLLEAPLKMSNVNTYFSSNAEVRKKLFKITETLFPEVRALRIWGSGTLELAQLAENLTNIVIYGKCGVWDIAVAKLILQEAGGSLTDWQGIPLELDLNDHDKTYQVLACHPSHLDTLADMIVDM